MEIKKPVKTINSYWLKTAGKIKLTAILASLAETITISLGFYILLDNKYDLTLFLICVLTLLIMLTSINIVILYHIARPLKDLLAALAKANDETTTSLVQPNINSKKYENTGFKTAVSLIYSKMNVLSNQKEITSEEESTIYSTLESLDRLTSKIITLDSSGHITYHSKGSPVKTEPGEDMTISLIFSGEDSLINWLNHAKENSVNAEKTWKRIPDQVPGHEDRRIFDVYANYKKGSASETVIAMVDRTNDYATDEEALDFIAFAAHELRGPITVIRGYIDVLYEELEDTLVDDQAELFKRLEVSANKLSGYVNNILNTSKFDRRHLKVNLSKDSYFDIYSGIADDMSLRATSQGRLLEVMIPQDLPNIAADRTSLSEVMSNLIDNAIKYSNEGGLINVTAKQTGEFVDFTITDRGIGMPSNVVANLFQKFYRSHRSRETVAGTGIGLYISKAIVESHGGNISVISEEGKGSSFTITLPTYDSISAKLGNDKVNQDIIRESGGWIENHGMYRG